MLENAFSLLRQFLPPDLSLPYLKAALIPVLETVEMAAGAMFLALIQPIV